MKAFIKQIGAGLLILIAIVAIYGFSFLTGGSLTTAESCSGAFIKGYMDIAEVKKSCPNLKKEEFKNSVEKDYATYGQGNNPYTREQLFKQIDNEY